VGRLHRCDLLWRGMAWHVIECFNRLFLPAFLPFSAEGARGSAWYPLVFLLRLFVRCGRLPFLLAGPGAVYTLCGPWFFFLGGLSFCWKSITVLWSCCWASKTFCATTDLRDDVLSLGERVCMQPFRATGACYSFFPVQHRAGISAPVE